MKINLKDLLFVFFSALYLEVIFKLLIFGDLLSFNMINIILLTIFISLIIYLFVSFFKSTINKTILFVITFGMCFNFSMQVVYFKTYNSIISFYSLKQAGQVMEFAGTMIDMAIKNIIPIILLFLPFIFLVVFHNKLFKFKMISKISKLIVLLSIGIVYLLGLLLLQVNKNEMYSAYNLYYNEHAPIMMADNFGLLTAMRLDFKRAVFGFEGKSYTYTKDETKKPIQEEKIYKPNIITIDFDSLIANESDSKIKNMHEYFKNVEPTYQNQYTGMFKGKNLILILAEALDPIAIDKTITPTLYKLVNEGFKFNNFYTPVFPVSTSDGEYIQQVSLIPHEGGWSLKDSYQNDLPFTLANMLLNQGYKTTAYHGHTGTYYGRYLSIPNLGYQAFYACKMGLNINCGSWPESDLEMIDASVPQYIDSEKFMTYYISISGHLNYTKVGNAMVRRNWDVVADLPYSDKVKGYLSAQKELDKALASLITKLEAAGKLEDTVIAINPDHYPYGLTLDEINEKSNYVRDDVFEKHRSVLIIWNSEMKNIEIDTLASNIDVLPTLANLFGLDYDSRLVMGKDILSKHESIVIYSNRSWITDKGKYNSMTKEYVGSEIDNEYKTRINKIIYNRFSISGLVLEKNYYSYLK